MWTLQDAYAELKRVQKVMAMRPANRQGKVMLWVDGAVQEHLWASYCQALEKIERLEDRLWELGDRE